MHPAARLGQQAAIAGSVGPCDTVALFGSRVEFRRLERRRRTFALFAAFALNVGTLAASETSPASEVRTGHALPNSITLTRSEIREIFLNDPFGLERFLGFQAGMSFHATGDFGSEDWIMVRGFGRDDSRIVLVLVDGRPINQRTNTVDLSDVILGSIERMTIHPGPIPARFGGYHAVIEITTRRNVNTTFASATAGSLSSYGLSAGLLRSKGHVYFGAEFDLQTTDAQGGKTFGYQLRAVPPGPPSGRACQLPAPPGPPICLPTAIGQITFTEREYRHLVAQLHYGVIVSEQLDLTARLNHVHVRKSLGSDRWIPHKYAPAALDPANQRPQIDARNRDFTTLSLAVTTVPGSARQFDAIAWFTYEDEELGTNGKQYYLGEQRRDRYGVNAHYRMPLSKTLGVSFGGEFIGEKGSVRNAREVSFPWGIYVLVPHQRYYGTYVLADYLPWSSARLTAGIRLNGQSNRGTANRTSPVFSFEQALAGRRASLYLIHGENSRWVPPLELERFVAAGLEAPMETMRGSEVGARARIFDDRASMRLSYFWLDNTFWRLSRNQSVPTMGETRGAEASLDARLGSRTRVQLNLTRFEPPLGDVQSPGDYRWLANAGVFVKVSEALTLEATARRLGRFRTSIDDLSQAEQLFLQLPPFLRPPGFEGYGRFRQDPVTVIDVGATWRLPSEPRAGISLGVYNLTDRRYNTFPELPQWDLPNQMPGRYGLASFSYAF